MLKVFVDANVLYSRTLRDWLFTLRLQGDGMFSLTSSEDVLAETIRNLRRDNPTWPGGRITRLRASFDEFLDDVVEEYFPAELPYPFADPHDRHVHAAAVACEADFLLTTDGGFSRPDPAQADTLPYEVHHPDELFVLIDDSAGHMVRAVTDEQRRYWEHRKRTEPLSVALVNAGCPEFATRVTGHLRALSGIAAS